MEIAAAALLNRTLFKNRCMHVIYYCVEILLRNLKLFPFFFQMVTRCSSIASFFSDRIRENSAFNRSVIYEVSVYIPS